MVTTFREFWARSAHFGQNGGWDESRGARVFLVWKSRRPFGIFATADFHQIWSRNVVRSPVAESGKTFFAKSEVDNRSNRHLIQSTGCTAERYCLLHVVVQESGSFRDLVNSTTYGCKFAQFPDFGLFSLTP